MNKLQQAVVLSAIANIVSVSDVDAFAIERRIRSMLTNDNVVESFAELLDGLPANTAFMTGLVLGIMIESEGSI